MVKITGIYKITSPTGKVYIGQSVDIKKRWAQHKQPANRNGESRLKNSLNKHGVESHIFEEVERCEISELNERERYWQDHYSVLGENGLNLLLTESATLKQIVSVATRKKLSDANRGRKVSEETKEKIRQSLTGFKHSEETKKKCAITYLRCTEDSKRRMHESKINRSEKSKRQTKDSLKKSWANYSEEERQARINKSTEGRQKAKLKKQKNNE